MKQNIDNFFEEGKGQISNEVNLGKTYFEAIKNYITYLDYEYDLDYALLEVIENKIKEYFQEDLSEEYCDTPIIDDCNDPWA